MKQAILSALAVVVVVLPTAAGGGSLLDGKWAELDKAKTGSFAFNRSGTSPGISFDSGAGFATIETPLALKTVPMALSWEVTINKGLPQDQGHEARRVQWVKTTRMPFA